MIALYKLALVWALGWRGRRAGAAPDERTPFGKTALELDIGQRKTTRNVVYRKINGLEIYNAKGNVAFNLVREGANLIWRETEEAELATRVEAGANKLTVRSPGAFAVYFRNDQGIWHYSGSLDTVASFSRRVAKQAAPAAIAEAGDPKAGDPKTAESELRERLLHIEEELRMLREDYEHMRVRILFADSILDGIVEGMEPA